MCIREDQLKEIMYYYDDDARGGVGDDDYDEDEDMLSHERFSSEYS